MKAFIDFFDVGAGTTEIALTLSGSILIPASETTWPKSLPATAPKTDLLG